MAITSEFILDTIGNYTQVSVNGHTIAGITDQTPKEAVAKFVELCKQNESALAMLIRQRNVCIQRNMRLLDEGKQGKDWPAFRRLERLKDRLCKEAGIVDS